MSENTIEPAAGELEPGRAGASLSALPGEAGIPDVAEPKRRLWSRKGLLAGGLFIALSAGVAAVSFHRFAGSGQAKSDEKAKPAGDRPAASTKEPRLDIPPRQAVPAASTPAAGKRIPALVQVDEEPEPIGVRRRGQAGSSASNAKSIPPADQPIMIMSSGTKGRPPSQPTDHDAGSDGEASAPADPLAETRRNLQGYQQQLQGMLGTLARTSASAKDQAIGNPVAATMPGAAAVLGQAQGAPALPIAASQMHNRSLTLPKGTAFTCALKNKVVSAASGLIGCTVQRNVYSDDGRVLLVERGSHMDGEYRIASVRPGTIRIPVVWTRIRTPNGVTVDLDSPGTGQLGESGIDGHVDNRWGERIGAATLLSIIDDAVNVVVQNQAKDPQADTLLLPSTTDNTSKLAEKVLDSTINIPPIIYRNQGGIVGIHVARDVDFSPVYELQAVTR